MKLTGPTDVPAATRAKAWDILVVDADPATGELVRQGGRTRVGSVRLARSVDEASLEMKSRPADVVVVNLQINDNAGLELLRKLRKAHPAAETIAMSRLQRTELCVDALRAGATDMLIGTITPEDIRKSLDSIAARRADAQRLTARNTRLRLVCKRLNKARHEISQQVDLLCNDLVRAYQEMAQQLNHAQVTTEYAAMLADELEVEGILRRTMEWILKKLGPINAAVYLPDADRKFALGAYLNLDTEADAALISSIGQTIVSSAESAGRAIALASDEQLTEHYSNDAALMHGRTWLASSCFSKRECLAVLVIFRRQNEPIDAHLQALVEAVCPLLGEKIEEALDLYNRMNPIEGDDPTAS
jgi:DNA-binding response OmpR family regulator